MTLDEMIETKHLQREWLLWDNNCFTLVKKIPKNRENNRETLAHLYVACVDEVKKKRALSFEQASRIVRLVWREACDFKRIDSLPSIVGTDGFLRMYALGLPCSTDLLSRIWRSVQESTDIATIEFEPIYVEWNESKTHFYDVNATPPGILTKFFPKFRLKKDHELLIFIAHDLEQISKIADHQRRTFLTLAILSHGAAYRELDGYQILVPSFTEQGKLIPYKCEQHMIAEGLKTVSLKPLTSNVLSIYLCQGTEIWPSQPSVLGSILANLGEHGSATEVYAHSWRRIHQHLRSLGTPLVAGHSMGGALAMQIGLYSHDLIERVYAFNPPVPNERDYAFYHQMLETSKKKIQVIVNLDDFAFWRIGSKVIGEVTLFMGKRRWRYYSVNLRDCILFIPAFIKFFRNVHNAFPEHQRIVSLYENWVSVKLTKAEIEQENQERTRRFDYLRFLPKLYDPTKVCITHIRKIFKWHLEEQYLQNEIEILALHERDLLDTLEEANKEEIEQKLAHIRSQKNELIQKLLKRRHK